LAETLLGEETVSAEEVLALGRTRLLSRLQSQGRSAPFKSLEQAEADWEAFADEDGGDARLELLREAFGELDARAARTIELRYRLRCSRALITRRLGLSEGEVDPLLRGAEASLREVLFAGPSTEPRPGRERILDLALREVFYECPDPFPEVRRPDKSERRATTREEVPAPVQQRMGESDPFAQDPFAHEDPLEVSGEGPIPPPPQEGPDPFAASRGPNAFPQIAHYRIDGEIAKGNMGVVYRGFDPNLGRAVAIKMMLANREADPGLRRRFQNEARALARLNHPNVVRVHDCGVHKKSPYIVMALIEGEALQDLMDREGKLDGKITAKVGRGLADALIHVHRQDVLHRDIKPLNILLDRDGRPLLTDFGLAKDMAQNPHMTSIGIGTPGYWPPEQAFKDAGPLGPHSDIYGLGATLYAMLTGQSPYGVGSTGQILARMRDPIKPPSEVAPGLDAALEAIVLKCLARRPEDRYGSAGELRAALELYLRNPTRIPLGAQSQMGDVENPWLWPLVGLALILIMIVAGTVYALS
jgi:predicted Ser/Thr protein kinase